MNANISTMELRVVLHHLNRATALIQARLHEQQVIEPQMMAETHALIRDIASGAVPCGGRKLYRMINERLIAAGRMRISQTQLSLILQTLGFTRTRTNQGVRWFTAPETTAPPASPAPVT